MTPHDNLPDDDRPDDDLRDPLLSRLYRELPDVTPAPGTDARLRAAARRAVAAGPRRAGAGFAGHHWRGLAASAAALMLGVALTVHWHTQDTVRLEEVLASAPVTPPAGRAETPETAAADIVAAPPPAVAARAAQDRTAAPGPSAGNAPTAAAAAAKPAAPAAPVAAAPPAPAEVGEAAAPEMDALAAADARATASVAMEHERAGATAKAEALRETRRERQALSLRALPQAAAPAAQAAPAPVADYRALMAAGRFDEALATLPEPDAAEADVTTLLDRDLLRQWQAPGRMPACARVDAAALGTQAPLCTALRALAAGHAAGNPALLPGADGLSGGSLAYRRALLDALFPAKTD